ncbi:transcription factor S [Methanothrix sp.]|uniref:transcription factor S n=1 Tax=Methanothrix sp. TaxID=90426 RepID=UPI0034E29D13
MFCPKCGSLMVSSAGQMKCRKCGFIQSSKGEGRMKITTVRSDRDIRIIDGGDISTLPTCNTKCPKCGHNSAYWWLRQLRAADESEVRFFRCTRCGNTWREYD